MSKLTLTYPVLCLITNPEVPDLVTRVEEALSAGVNMLQLRGHTLPAAELYGLALELRSLCHRYRTIFIVNDRIDVGLVTGADGFQLGARSLPLVVARQLIGEDYLLGASVHSPEEALAARAGGADFLLAGTIFPSHTHPGEPPSGTDLLRAIRRDTPIGANFRGFQGASAPWRGSRGVPLKISLFHAPPERKRGLGTPQTPAGEDPCTPLGKGEALKLTPMRDTPKGHSTCSLLAVGGITQANARQAIQAGADGIAVISAILSSANVKQAVEELRMAIKP